ncbi:winged helix-turn-helix transcriptional regulator [Bacillus timonensis]|nr:winged helix-turn-helix transcriptional regulator [Bacillus timonensis]
MISGKWKMVILWYLHKDGSHRFNELQRLLPKITHKMLSNQLKELLEDGLVHREVFAEVPPRVEYTLTELGKSLMPIIEQMYDWGKDRIKELKKHDITNTDLTQ